MTESTPPSPPDDSAGPTADGPGANSDEAGGRQSGVGAGRSSGSEGSQSFWHDDRGQSGVPGDTSALSRRTLLKGGAALGLGPLAVLTRGETHANTTGESDDTATTVRPASELSTSPSGSEGLLASPELLSEWGVASGQQIRLRRTDDEFAVFTVEAVGARAPERTVWLTDDGRARLGTQAAFEVTVESPVPHPSQTATTAAGRGEYVERVRDRGGRGLVVGAPHGGYIEPYTDRQASRVAENVAGSTAWIGRGWRPGGGAYERWHVTSTDIHPASFPALETIADRGFEYAVSFHGFGGEGIRVGGGAPGRVKREVQTALEAAIGDVLDVRPATDGAYAGSDPDNFVNWLTANGRNGVQIEQSFEARSDYWHLVADAVAGVFE